MLPNSVFTQIQLGTAGPGFKPHDPVIEDLVQLRAAFLFPVVRTTHVGSDWPAAIVSKVDVNAQIKCKSSYQPQQPQQSSNISLPLVRDYNARKGGQLTYDSYNK